MWCKRCHARKGYKKVETGFRANYCLCCRGMQRVYDNTRVQNDEGKFAYYIGNQIIWKDE